jgi:tetratricopeptide (TPR) repeat protein
LIPKLPSKEYREKNMPKEKKPSFVASAQLTANSIMKKNNKAKVNLAAEDYETAKKQFLEVISDMEEAIRREMPFVAQNKQAFFTKLADNRVMLASIIRDQIGPMEVLPYYEQAAEDYKKAIATTGLVAPYVRLVGVYDLISEVYRGLIAKSNPAITPEQKADYIAKGLRYSLEAIKTDEDIPKAWYGIDDYVTKASSHRAASLLYEMQGNSAQAVVYLQLAVTTLQRMEVAKPGALATKISTGSGTVSGYFCLATYYYDIANLQSAERVKQIANYQEAIDYFNKAIQQGEKPSKEHYEQISERSLELSEYHRSKQGLIAAEKYLLQYREYQLQVDAKKELLVEKPVMTPAADLPPFRSSVGVAPASAKLPPKTEPAEPPSSSYASSSNALNPGGHAKKAPSVEELVTTPVVDTRPFSSLVGIAPNLANLPPRSEPIEPPFPSQAAPANSLNTVLSLVTALALVVVPLVFFFRRKKHKKQASRTLLNAKELSQQDAVPAFSGDSKRQTAVLLESAPDVTGSSGDAVTLPTVPVLGEYKRTSTAVIAESSPAGLVEKNEASKSKRQGGKNKQQKATGAKSAAAVSLEPTPVVDEHKRAPATVMAESSPASDVVAVKAPTTLSAAFFAGATHRVDQAKSNAPPAEVVLDTANNDSKRQKSKKEKPAKKSDHAAGVSCPPGGLAFVTTNHPPGGLAFGSEASAAPVVNRGK